MPRMDWRAVLELKRKCRYTASRYWEPELRKRVTGLRDEATHHGVPPLNGGVKLHRTRVRQRPLNAIPNVIIHLRVPCIGEKKGQWRTRTGKKDD